MRGIDHREAAEPDDDDVTDAQIEEHGVGGDSHPGHPPPGHLAEEGGAAAEPRHRDARDEALVFRKPGEPDGHGYQVDRSHAYPGQDSDACRGQDEGMVPQARQNPPPSEKQSSQEGGFLRPEPPQDFVGKDKGQGEDEIEDGKRRLKRSLHEPRDLLQRAHEDGPRVGGAEAHLHEDRGYKDGVSSNGMHNFMVRNGQSQRRKVQVSGFRSFSFES